jgi:hypothetical protein
VKASVGGGNRKVKATEWEAVKTVESSAEPDSSKVTPATGRDDGWRSLAQEDGGQGALCEPESRRGSIQT